MEKMIGYVFGTLKDYEKFMIRVNKTLRKQRRTNRMVMLFAAGMIGCTYLQNQRIERLTAQLEELKYLEGE